MATKTFKTRIKLKYDSLLSVQSFNEALKGEMLLGHDNNSSKVYAYVGTSDVSTPKALWISGNNVDITGYPNNGVTAINTVQDAITNLDSRISTIANSMVISFGDKTGAITLNGTSGLSMSGNELKIATATADQFGVVKVKPGNGLTFDEGLIGLETATTDEPGAMSTSHFNKLEGIDAGAQVNIIEGVNVNGQGLTVNANKAVDITIVEGNTNGSILVNNQSVLVHGLGSAAYTDLGDYATAAQGAKADRALQSISASGDGEFVTTTVSVKGTGDTTQTVGVSVTTHDIATADATADNGDGLATAADVKSYVSSQLTGIVGAMVYKGTVSSDANLPTANTSGVQAGWTYVVSTAGTYNGQSCEIGDMIIVQSVENGTIKFNIVNGENQVSSANATITAGADAATTVATVDGTDINVKVGVTAGNAVIAKSVDGVVTLKAGLTQNGTSGSIKNNTGNDITLAKVATTGKAVDVSIADNGDLITATNVEDALAEIVGKVNANATGIEAVENRMTVAEGKISTLESKMNTAESDINALQSLTNSHDGEIDGLQGEVNALKGRVDTAEGDINDLEELVGTTPVATQISNAINGLSNGGETIASVADDGVVTLSKTITQTDGKIDIAENNNSITLAKVATTGAAADVALADENNNYEANTVEGALNEILTWEFIFECGNASDNV